MDIMTPSYIGRVPHETASGENARQASFAMRNATKKDDGIEQLITSEGMKE